MPDTKAVDNGKRHVAVRCLAMEHRVIGCISFVLVLRGGAFVGQQWAGKGRQQRACERRGLPADWSDWLYPYQQLCKMEFDTSS